VAAEEKPFSPVTTLFASQSRTASSQSSGSPSDQVALSLKVYFTVSGLSEVFSKVP